ncbi:uncharacterized protein B0H18DRAFT_1027321 [Fomitopsis serialis]|uniref:uncharacterized protein n=1 Tax=Fomitopsis serialis TaxID=139415 RepID=UPI002007990E|nr:uncharacterized protein B0H18DRAFT_1027321 [Neoantrodia serialis]KAH9919642.1 hypothetical protein B0H18DRAFT_1027321 [Neoantrodia serialis]
MASLVSSIVQCFFAWRIYTLSKRSILTGIIVVLVHTPSVGDVLASTSGRAIMLCIWIGGTVLVDVIIAIAMTLLMLKMRTSFAHSNRIINKLIRFTLETGALTAGNSIIGVILALAFPNQSYYMPARSPPKPRILVRPASTVNHNDHILTSMTSAHTSTPTRDIEMSSLNYKVPTLAGTMASD